MVVLLRLAPSEVLVARLKLTPATMELVAERFKALAEPARLRLLQCLQAGELSVNELVEATSLGQANVSKHMQILHAMGLVTRRKEGLFVYYALADEDVLRLCEIMCGRVAAQERRHRARIAS